MAGAPPYDPTLSTVDASYFFGLYPYYGYQGYMAFLPTTTGYPYVVHDKTPTGERGD